MNSGYQTEVQLIISVFVAFVYWEYDEEILLIYRILSEGDYSICELYSADDANTG